MGLTELQTLLKDWSTDRPLVHQNNTLEKLLTLLQAEMVEFEESPDPTELADILIYALSIGNLMGWDMDQEVREKVALNSIRFPASSFQEGNYTEARLEAKRNERKIIDEFYE